MASCGAHACRGPHASIASQLRASPIRGEEIPSVGSRRSHSLDRVQRSGLQESARIRQRALFGEGNRDENGSSRNAAASGSEQRVDGVPVFLQGESAQHGGRQLADLLGVLASAGDGDSGFVSTKILAFAFLVDTYSLLYAIDRV